MVKPASTPATAGKDFDSKNSDDYCDGDCKTIILDETPLSEEIAARGAQDPNYWHAERRCKHCKNFFTNYQQAKVQLEPNQFLCRYHPGTFVAVSNLRSNRIRGYTCCSKERAGEGKIVRTRFQQHQSRSTPGCKFVKYHVEDVQYSTAIGHFSAFDMERLTGEGKNEIPETTEVVSDLSTATPHQFPAPWAGENEYPDKETDHFIRHAISKKDTLAGLSVKYDVSSQDIMRVNRMYTRDFGLRRFIYIPKNNVNYNLSVEQDEVHSSNQSGLISQFLAKRDGVSKEEASFYLEDNGWNLEAALQEHAEDNQWAHNGDTAFNPALNPSSCAESSQQQHTTITTTGRTGLEVEYKSLDLAKAPVSLTSMPNVSAPFHPPPENYDGPAVVVDKSSTSSSLSLLASAEDSFLSTDSLDVRELRKKKQVTVIQRRPQYVMCSCSADPHRIELPYSAPWTSKNVVSHEVEVEIYAEESVVCDIDRTNGEAYIREYTGFITVPGSPSTSTVAVHAQIHAMFLEEGRTVKFIPVSHKQTVPSRITDSGPEDCVVYFHEMLGAPCLQRGSLCFHNPGRTTCILSYRIRVREARAHPLHLSAGASYKAGELTVDIVNGGKLHGPCEASYLSLRSIVISNAAFSLDKVKSNHGKVEVNRKQGRLLWNTSLFRKLASVFAPVEHLQLALTVPSSTPSSSSSPAGEMIHVEVEAQSRRNYAMRVCGKHSARVNKIPTRVCGHGFVPIH